MTSASRCAFDGSSFWAELAVLAREDEIEHLLLALLDVNRQLESIGEHRTQHRDAILGRRTGQRRRRRVRDDVQVARSVLRRV